MALLSPKLKWCVVHPGQDTNWWVEKTSDPVHWDTVDGLSILDPRQVSHILEALQQLIEYGFQLSSFNRAFYRFHVVEDLGKGKIKLERVGDSLLDSTEQLFALPDIIDEEKGPYADLINQITKARIKMLNDVIELDQHTTVEELEDEIRELHNEDYMEGKAVHVFNEISSILEYVPHGYEIDEDEEKLAAADIEGSSQLDEEFPDLEEEELEQDETMRWDDDDDFEDDEDDEDSDDDDEDDDEDEDDEPRSKKGAKKKS